ncbi:hypothetical protein CEXT_172581 [Caerostris extrusa]|uniref:Uncharacterized protein n=1 Tax=Caerostris extrusa TaxID=172846 RepID=A0AAV4VHV6_CAEEX|nr:hypothetical protein CEXT_172581 [Caerostris extrusa]
MFFTLWPKKAQQIAHATFNTTPSYINLLKEKKNTSYLRLAIRLMFIIFKERLADDVDSKSSNAKKSNHTTSSLQQHRKERQMLTLLHMDKLEFRVELILQNETHTLIEILVLSEKIRVACLVVEVPRNIVKFSPFTVEPRKGNKLGS